VCDYHGKYFLRVAPDAKSVMIIRALISVCNTFPKQSVNL